MPGAAQSASAIASGWGRVTREANFYDVLGVRPSATQAQIKAAYVVLMKRFHPDSPLRSPGPDSAGQVRTINAAYSVLKDPRKRGRYDLDLRGGAARNPLVAPPRPAAKRSWLRGGGSLALLLLLGVLTASLVTSQQTGGDAGLGSSTFALLSSIERRGSNSTGDAGFVQMTPALRAAAVAATGVRSSHAVDYSARCFARARSDASAAAADRCVVFDLAYAYWHENDGSADIAPIYFQEQNMEARDLEALAALGAEGASIRFDALRAATFSILLQQVRRLSAAEDERAKTLENAVPDETGPPTGNLS